jgi:hypothetical protein
MGGRSGGLTCKIVRSLVAVWSKLLTFKLINNCLPTTDVGEGSLGIAEEHHFEAREGRIEQTSFETSSVCASTCRKVTAKLGFARKRWSATAFQCSICAAFAVGFRV